jgi:hypothetical protein
MPTFVRLGFVAAACLLAVPLADAHAQSHSAAPDPQRIALTTRDLPAGFVQALAHHTTNAAIARENGLPVKVYNSLGRVIGYEVAYKASSGRTTSVDVQVVRYRSTAGATQAFVLGQQMVAGAYADNHAFHAMLDSAGDTAVQSFLRTVAGQRQQVYIITSHAGKYVISTELHFRPGTAKAAMTASALRLQRVMLARTPGATALRLDTPGAST